MGPRVLRNRALVTLMAGHFSNDLLVGVLPVLYPTFRSQFGLDNTQLGLITLAYAVASSLTQPFFGYVSDRFRRYWLPPLLVLWAGVFVGLYGFATGYASLFVLAILAGLGSAAFHPLGATNAARVVTAGAHNTSMSLYTVAGTAGFALGPLIAVIFINLFGPHGTLGFTALAALSAALMLPEMRRIRSIDGRHVEVADTAPADLPPADYSMLVRIIGAVMLRSWSYMAILQFTPVWYDELGRSDAFFGLLITVITLFSALGTLIGGALADRTGGRLIVVGSLALTMPAMLLYTRFPGDGAFISGPLYGMLSDSSSAIALLAAQRLLPGRTGLASSTILGLGFVSGGLGVPIVGKLVDSVGYGNGLALLVFVNLAATLLAATVPASVWGVRSRMTPAEPETVAV